MQKTEIKEDKNLEETRFQIVKAMLKEFPELRGRVKEYLEKDVI